MGLDGTDGDLEPLEFYMDHRKADLPAGKSPPVSELKAIFTDRQRSDIPLSWRIENVFMVAAGIRRSSMFHPRTEKDVLEVRELARAYGVGYAVRRAGIRVLKVFLFGKEREEKARSIPDIDESMGEREFIAAQIAIANMTGQFLDFPRCCTDSFVKHLMQCTDQDEHAMVMLQGSKESSPRAYFVERFIPCSPVCSAAIEEGLRIEGELNAKAPGILPLYEKLRMDHMEEVRSGRIIAEKKQRDIDLLKRSDR
jgi:hypothetical protein